MQKWEYHTASLVADLNLLGRVKSWKIKTINDEIVTDWCQQKGYSSLKAFCDQMGKEGWELVSSNSYGEGILLFFKRPYE